MTIDYNLTLIYYIKLLKSQKIIKTWKEGAKIYFDFEQQEISPTALGNQANKILMSSVNPQLLFEYCELTEQYLKSKTQQEKPVETKIDKTEKDTIIRSLSIPKEDYETIFNIDIENDSREAIRQKIMNKISDDLFLLTYLGFNPGRFEVQKITTGAWTTPVKVENESGEKTVETVLNEKFSVSIVRRKKPILFYTKEECDSWLDEFLSTRKITPFDFFEDKYGGSKKQDHSVNDDLVMVCPGFEAHIGKLGSVVDFEDFSTKQAMWRLKQTALEIVEYQKKHKAQSLILGVGNDYFNSDTVDDKTTAGTQQHNDTRFKEVYLWGKIGYFQIIETLKEQFNKIIIKGNPGNHDEKSSFSLFTNIYDVYNITKDEKVDVQFSYKDLRYTTCYEFGKNLIVFSHGKSPEGRNLKDQLLAESIKYQFPEEYNRADNVYVFAGHIHQDSENKFDKVTVIRTASLTGIENWHYSNLYIGQRQGHSVYLIDKDKGYVGKHNITLTKEDRKKTINSIDRDENTNVVNTMTKAMDLNPDSMEKELNAKELTTIKRKIGYIKGLYRKKLNKLAEQLGINLEEYDKKEIEKMINTLGYEKEVKQLEAHKQLVLKYKRPFDK